MSGSFPSLDQFPHSGLPDWEKAATEELKGGNPWEKLSWKEYGLEVKPYLDATLAGTPPPLLKPSGDLYRGPRTWHNMPAVNVTNAATANQEALESLRAGADGICFVMSGATSWEQLLQGIDWSICTLCFVSQSPEGNPTGLSDYIRKNYAGAELHGTWFSGSPETVIGLSNGMLFPQIMSPIEALTQGYATALQTLGVPQAISLTVETNFFLEMAKLRSARTVHALLLDHFKQDHPLLIHARSLAWPSPSYDPHSTMLKHTTSAMASIMGGCDLLTLEEDTSGGTMTRRIARQVSNLLREESHLGRVADPVAGSYLVEDLTRQISTAVWDNLKPLLKR